MTTILNSGSEDRNFRKILGELATYDFDLAKVRFDGADDSGQISEIRLFNFKDGVKRSAAVAQRDGDTKDPFDEHDIDDDELLQLDISPELRPEHRLLWRTLEGSDDIHRVRDDGQEHSTVESLIESFAAYLLYERIGPWEIDGGSFGEIFIQPKATKISIDVAYRQVHEDIVILDLTAQERTDG